MIVKLSKFLLCVGTILLVFSTAIVSAPDAMAGEKYRKEYRRHDGEAIRHAAVEHDVRRHERERRAFIAGAAAQQHREDNRNYYRDDYRGGYRDRYRDRYYDDDDDHDNKVGAALVGAAVGAVITGVVMSNSNNNSTSSNSNSSNDSK